MFEFGLQKRHLEGFCKFYPSRICNLSLFGQLDLQALSVIKLGLGPDRHRDHSILHLVSIVKGAFDLFLATILQIFCQLSQIRGIQRQER